MPKGKPGEGFLLACISPPKSNKPSLYDCDNQQDSTIIRAILSQARQGAHISRRNGVEFTFESLFDRWRWQRRKLLAEQYIEGIWFDIMLRRC
jgi:hypothetical protein